MGLKLKTKKDKPSAPPAAPVEIVPTQVIVQEPQESAKITLTQRRGLPILTERGPVDLVAQDAELSRLPRFSCNTCHIGADCPSYRPGTVCAFEKSFAAFPLRDIDSVLAVMTETAERTKIRYRRAVLSEELVSGGATTPEVTKLSDQLLRQLGQLLELSRASQTVSLTVMGTQQKEGGILQKLFGGPPAKTTELVALDSVELNPEDPEKR